MSAIPVPSGRDAEAAAVLQPSRVALRGGIAADAASRRRGTMGSRVAAGKTREAIYPMFLDLARQASADSFWQGFFMNMAMGKFPKGVILRDDCLVHRSRKKTTTFELSQEARSDWQTVADFFRTTCDILSGADWLQRQPSPEVVVQLTTAQINKRIKKEHANAIPEFTLALKARHNLSPAEMNEVDVLLRYYSSSNLFRPGDVLYGPSGAIREIKTLAFDQVTRRFAITAEAKAPRYTMHETYQDLISYLTAPPFTKPVERKIGFDDEIRKHLRLLYAPQVAAREKAAAAALEKALPIKSLAARKIVVEPVAEDVVTEDDEVEPMIGDEHSHRRHQSDDDSS